MCLPDAQMQLHRPGALLNVRDSVSVLNAMITRRMRLVLYFGVDHEVTAPKGKDTLERNMITI